MDIILTLGVICCFSLVVVHSTLANDIPSALEVKDYIFFKY